MKSMNGHIIRGTSICVDYWLSTEKKYIHFLSHLHADHTYNLKSSFREYIYTSPFNSWLVKRWFNIDPDLVVPLSLGASHVIFDENTQTNFSVTLLDANHCPGSIMFLFQGTFGNILYTGDFRYNPQVLDHPMLKSVIENEMVDILYLDNTFAAEQCEFPPRQEALKDIIDLIREHPDYHIVLGLRKLGKEEVLKEIAMEFKEKIFVTEERMKILSYLQYGHVFTTNQKESRIFVKEMYKINSSYLHKLQEEKGPVLTILLTALYSVIPPNVECSMKLKNTNRSLCHIPYSDHSCHSELLEFVSKVKPHVIYPIVANSNELNKIDISNNGKETPYELYNFPHRIYACSNSVIPHSILKLSKNPAGFEYVVRDEGRVLTQPMPVSLLPEHGSMIGSEFATKHICPQKMLTDNENPQQMLTDNEIKKISQNTEKMSESCPYITCVSECTNQMFEDEFASMSDDNISQLSPIPNVLSSKTKENSPSESVKSSLLNTFGVNYNGSNFVKQVKKVSPLLKQNQTLSEKKPKKSIIFSMPSFNGTKSFFKKSTATPMPRKGQMVTRKNRKAKLEERSAYRVRYQDTNQHLHDNVCYPKHSFGSYLSKHAKNIVNEQFNQSEELKSNCSSCCTSISDKFHNLLTNLPQYDKNKDSFCNEISASKNKCEDTSSVSNKVKSILQPLPSFKENHSYQIKHENIHKRGPFYKSDWFYKHIDTVYNSWKASIKENNESRLKERILDLIEPVAHKDLETGIDWNLVFENNNHT